MPAGYAHLDFGNQVLKTLDPKLQEVINQYIDLYHIGVHGPDILFYHQPLKNNVVKSLGYQMHKHEAYDFFNQSKHIVKKSSNKEASLAYILGFITHFTLDSECHGYVGEVERTKHLTHSEIESEFDRELLIHNGFNPLTTSLTSHIHQSDMVDKVIAPFFQLQPQDIKKSLKGMLTYLGFLLAPGKIKRNIVLTAMKVAGIYEGYKGLMINYEKNPICKDDVEELMKKKEHAILIAKTLIDDYIYHLDDKELNERFRRNYE
ncbi:MAG: zinc dependent phospholipase C family protein [Coprobacillus sp.]